MTERRRLLGWGCAAAVVLFSSIGMSGAATPDCGSPRPGSPPDAEPLRADLTPTVASHTITLGRSVEGHRRWEVEFGWTADCTPRLKDTDARIRLLQGTDASLEGSAIESTVEVDEDARRAIVMLKVPRDPEHVPAGKFEGTLELGNGAIGLGKATIVIQHQEPVARHNMNFLEQIIWIGGWFLAAALVFWIPRWLCKKRGVTQPATQDYTTPLAIIALAMAIYPLAGNMRRDRIVPAPWWPIWLGAAGLFGGFLIGVLKHRAGGAPLVGGRRFASALVLSFGAGIAAWKANYLDSSGWALSLDSAMTLLSVVGGATAAAALLLLVPSKETGGTESGRGSPPSTGGSGSGAQGGGSGN